MSLACGTHDRFNPCPECEAEREIESLRSSLTASREEARDADRVRARLGEILDAVCGALKPNAPPGVILSYSDLPDLARAAREEARRAAGERDEAMRKSLANSAAWGLELAGLEERLAAAEAATIDTCQRWTAQIDGINSRLRAVLPGPGLSEDDDLVDLACARIRAADARAERLAGDLRTLTLAADRALRRAYEATKGQPIGDKAWDQGASEMARHLDVRLHEELDEPIAAARAALANDGKGETRHE